MDCSLNGAKAFMLIAVTAVDGAFDPGELRTIKPTLMRAGLSDPEADAALIEALRHYREVIDGDTLDKALLECARRLKEDLAVPDLRAFMTQLVDAALADNRFQQSEHAFLKVLGAAWDV